MIQNTSHIIGFIFRRVRLNLRIMNESQIVLLLEEHGFETVLCEDLSLAKQVTLFAKTTAITGAHGGRADQSDIYCMADSFVGEICIDGVPPAYLVMSQQLGMWLNRFKANTLAVEQSQSDMQVNPAAFRKWICDCLDPLKHGASNPSKATNAVIIDDKEAPKPSG
jgi:hypothetical protein